MNKVIRENEISSPRVLTIRAVGAGTASAVDLQCSREARKTRESEDDTGFISFE